MRYSRSPSESPTPIATPPNPPPQRGPKYDIMPPDATQFASANKTSYHHTP